MLPCGPPPPLSFTAPTQCSALCLIVYVLARPEVSRPQLGAKFGDQPPFVHKVLQANSHFDLQCMAAFAL